MLSQSLRSMLKQTPARRVLTALRHWGIDGRDVLLASYPKSGNTWLKFMAAELVTGGDRDVFSFDNDVVPFVGFQKHARRLLPGGGRLIKTHEPYRPCYQRAIYIVRDVRDVVVSYYFHQQRVRGSTQEFGEFVRAFCEGRVDGYGTWAAHVGSWLDSPLAGRGGLLVLRYEDIRLQAAGQLGKICEFLKLPVDAERIATAIEQNSLQAMREKEQQSAFMQQRARDPGTPFVREGKSGGWRERLAPADLELLLDRCGPVLSRLGYEDASAPALSTGGDRR